MLIVSPVPLPRLMPSPAAAPSTGAALLPRLSNRLLRPTSLLRDFSIFDDLLLKLDNLNASNDLRAANGDRGGLGAVVVMRGAAGSVDVVLGVVMWLISRLEWE